MNASVGPLSTSPPTIGLTASTGAGARAIASRIPGSARMGAIEASEVGIGRDVRAVDLDVVARVGHHDDALGSQRFGHAARELGTAGAPREDHHLGRAHSHTGSGRPVRRMPAWAL